MPWVTMDDGIAAAGGFETWLPGTVSCEPHCPPRRLLRQPAAKVWLVLADRCSPASARLLDPLPHGTERTCSFDF
jgi:hypothetical protein